MAETKAITLAADYAMPLNTHHYCAAAMCKAWIPKTEGYWCSEHRSIAVSNAKQCTYSNASGVCTTLTACQFNGKPMCPQHMHAMIQRRSTPEDYWDPDEFYSIEDIEFEPYKRNWNSIEFRKGKYPTVDSIHFKFKLKGPEKNQMLFHAMLKAADDEYPLDPERKRNKPLQVCDKCGGFFWHNAVPDPDQIKRAAKQAGLKKVVMLKWLTQQKCAGKLVDKLYNHGVAS